MAEILNKVGDSEPGSSIRTNQPALNLGPGPLRPGSPMPKPLQYALGAYVVAMFAVILYLLVKTWPLSTTGAEETTNFFWGSVTMAAEIRLMLVAALAGALGAYVHLATSFADYAGNEGLTTNWGWWYLLRPFIGMALAEVVYLALRGGLLSAGGANTTGAISVYGVAAVTALTGLFSKQATDKLQEVFETLFRTTQKVARKDALPTAANLPPDSGPKTSAAAAGR
ncbi:MAG: hypothetical protein LAP40_16640 [Acidobacteriia bacterium]|nr:hypothetical protein [Terriglobia bacterium]